MIFFVRKKIKWFFKNLKCFLNFIKYLIENKKLYMKKK